MNMTLKNGWLLALLLTACVDQGAEEKRLASHSASASAASLDFTCDTSAVTAETTLRAVAGAAGETLAIAPTKESCRYDLFYKDAHNGRRKISEESAFQAITHAERFTDTAQRQTTVVCISPIRHHQAATGSTISGHANRTIDGVQLSCTVQRGAGWAMKSGDDGWSKLQRLVDGGHDYAPWVVNVIAAPLPPAGHEGEHESGDDRRGPLAAFTATWVRDSTFQFFNFSDAGRPASDGVFQTSFTVDSQGKIEVGATTRVSTSISVISATGG